MLKQILLALGLFASALNLHAVNTFNFAGATAIDSVPYVISSPGNYYLAHNVTFSSTGFAITITCHDVVLDLNGRSINASGVAKTPYAAHGVVVVNQEDVTVQDGDINDFGGFGVYFAASDSSREHNQKNDCLRVNFNNDTFGVVIVSGSIDEVENCNFDGGAAGIYDIASLGGDRIQQCNFENQRATESVNAGWSIASTPGAGILVEDCLFSRGSNPIALLLQGATDRFRFNSFVGGAGRWGGTEEAGGDI